MRRNNNRNRRNKSKRRNNTKRSKNKRSRSKGSRRRRSRRQSVVKQMVASSGRGWGRVLVVICCDTDGGDKEVATHTLREDFGEDGGSMDVISAGWGMMRIQSSKSMILLTQGNADPVEIEAQYGKGYLGRSQ